jgi:Pentapeptide repeats (8 copies)
MPYNPSVRGRRQWLREGRRYWGRLRLALAVIAGLVALASLVALGGFVWLWWKGVPALYQDSGAGPDARVQAVTGTRTALLIGLAGVGAVGALWLNNRTYRLTQQGQITDRYTKAIEQLGAEKLAVRLGGIYALERIAVDSKRDHQTVVEVLSAFVRERTDASRTEKQTVVEVPKELFQETDQSKINEQTLSDSKARLTTDVQAVLTVLGRLPHRKIVGRGDLQGALLIGAELGNADLSGAQLREANLSRATLREANLSRAMLRKADLSRAELVVTDLADAWLEEADLRGARLLGADLSGAILWRRSLREWTCAAPSA